MAKLKDVAELAHVSIATVSRILNNDTTLSVTDETRKAVYSAAEELNYTIKSKPSRITFAIIQWYSPEQEINDPYYITLRQGAEAYLKSRHIAVKRLYQNDLDVSQSLSNVDGILCIGKFSSDYIQLLKTYSNNIVLLDMINYPCREVSIVLDFDDALRQVIDYFRLHDHQKIGYLGGIEYLENHQSQYNDPRRESFIKHCQKHSIDFVDYMKEGQFSSESGYNMMSEMIASNNLPTALFASSDPIAIGAMRALQDHGYHIPKDISIIGFDNIEAANFTNPPLTTVYTPAFEMGETAAKVLCHNQSSSSPIIPMRIQMPCYIIERESV